MGIVAKQMKEREWEIAPQGTHIARCISMIHIGTVAWEYLGEQKNTEKVRLTFELPMEMRSFDEAAEQPMTIDKEYTLSMYEQSNLRKDLESWRGQAFSKEEESSFDITNLLGVACNVSIVHKVSKKGKEYAVIGAITTLTKGTKCPKQFNESFQFNYNDDFNTKWLDNECNSWLQETIKSTPEYKERIGELEGHEQMKKEVVNDDLPF